MKNIFKINYLRNIFIVSLIIAIILPAAVILYIYPSFTAQLTQNTEDEAIRVARHLTVMIIPDKNELTKDSVSAELMNKIQEVTEDFKLMKLKTFSKSGKTIYSTSPKDIGVINKNRYFHDIVAKGKVYTKVVEKDTKSLEDQIVTVDVVETYVPIMKSDAFVGAFEIYYDITARKERIEAILSTTSVAVFILVISLMGSIISVLIRAGKNIIRREQIEEALRGSEQKYRTVLESNPDPVVVYDTEGKVLYLNPAFTRVFGWSSKGRLGKKMDVFVPEETWPATKMMIDKVLAGEAFSGIETHRYTKEGKLIPVSVSGATYLDLEGNHVGTVVNLRDISEQKSLEKKLERLSYLDGLTGVANRRQFDKNLDLEWRRMARLDKSLSLIMCDIDFFKAYNDTYGHRVGDKCLKTVGNILMGSAKRAGDLVARYGGEEFGILLPMTDAEKVFKIAEKIQRDINSLKVPHIRSEVSGFVTLSFGIATLFPQTSKSPNDLVELADKALYQAKHEGRNKVIIS